VILLRVSGRVNAGLEITRLSPRRGEPRTLHRIVRTCRSLPEISPVKIYIRLIHHKINYDDLNQTRESAGRLTAMRSSPADGG